MPFSCGSAVSNLWSDGIWCFKPYIVWWFIMQPIDYQNIKSAKIQGMGKLGGFRIEQNV